MLDPIFEALDNILFEINNGKIMDATEFEAALTDFGFMIVPIEDPTNLRYGLEDE